LIQKTYVQISWDFPFKYNRKEISAGKAWY
jgi:hypothetical protein